MADTANGIKLEEDEVPETKHSERNTHQDYDYEDDGSRPRSFNPYFVGIEAEEVLGNGGTVEQLRTAFIEKSAALGITWKPSEVRLLYGEVSSE